MNQPYHDLMSALTDVERLVRIYVFETTCSCPSTFPEVFCWHCRFKHCVLRVDAAVTAASQTQNPEPAASTSSPDIATQPESSTNSQG
jgi:hypothetical protein